MNEKPTINAAKGSLPSKTKLAVWWLIGIGIWGAGLTIIGPFLTSLECSTCEGVSYLDVGFFCLYILPAILIYMKNRIAWISAVVILSGVMTFLLIEILISVISGYKVPSPQPVHNDYQNIKVSGLFLLFILIPFLLIILDRKNYFKMTRQRELEKKGTK